MCSPSRGLSGKRQTQHEAIHERGSFDRNQKYESVPSKSAAPSRAITQGEAGYLPRASPGGGRSTTTPPEAAALAEGKLPGSWRNSMLGSLTRLF